MMKKFAKALFVFIFPLLMVTIVFEIYLRTMETDYEQKLNGLKENYNTIELLILGNSHAYNGIDPNQFVIPAYNMAASNQSLYFDKRITLKHIEKLKNLKFVLINVDYHSLYFSSQGIRDTWLYYDYDIKYKDKNECLSDISHFWFGYTPKISLSIVKDKLLNYYKTSIKANDSIILGWMPHYGTKESKFTLKELKKKGKWFNREVDKSDEREEIISDLDDFIMQLKEKSITPILFTSPMYTELYQYLKKDHIIQNDIDIQKLIKKHNIKYWDYSKNDFNKSFFYDMDHLNNKGAIKFSKELNQVFIDNFIK